MDLSTEYVVVYSAIALIIIENLIEIYFFRRVSEDTSLFTIKFIFNKYFPSNCFLILMKSKVFIELNNKISTKKLNAV